MAAQFILAALVALLACVVHFVAGLFGVAGVVVSGVALGPLTFVVWDLRESEARGRLDLALPAAAGVAGVLGAALLRRALFASAEALPFDLTAAALCAVGAGVVVLVRARKLRTQCLFHRGRALDERSPRCPRCKRVFCGLPECWDAEGCRCAECKLVGRPLFPVNDAAFWEKHFGPRVKTGKCQRCKLSTRELARYDCPNCRWPTCVTCWDDENGRCTREDCGWVMQGLPADLRECMGRQGARAPRRPRGRAAVRQTS